MSIKNLIIIVLFVFSIISGLNITRVNGASQYIIKITMNIKDSFNIFIGYKDLQGQSKSYFQILEQGNQTYTINGELASIQVNPSIHWFGEPSAIFKMEIIRNNRVLISKTSQDGKSINWDSVKEPLPAENPLEQIPGFPIESILIGLVIVLTIFSLVRARAIGQTKDRANR